MIQNTTQDKLINLRRRIEMCDEEIDIPYHDALSRHFDRYARKNLDRDLTWYEMADPASIINTQSYITRRRLLGGAPRRAGQHDGGGRSGQGRGLCRLHRARPGHGP